MNKKNLQENFIERIERSSRVVRAPDCQSQSPNSPGFDPSILRHIGIWGAAYEAVWNKVQKRKKKGEYGDNKNRQEKVKI